MLEVLSRARPTWTARDAAVAQQKLAKIGVTTTSALSEALEGPLNDRLRDAGLRTFTVETIYALKLQLEASAAPPRADAVQTAAPAERRSEATAPAPPVASAERPSQGAAPAPPAKVQQDRLPRGDAKPLEPSGVAAAVPGFGPRFEVHTGEAECLGFWVSTHNGFVFEIRPADDHGFFGLPSEGAEATVVGAVAGAAAGETPAAANADAAADVAAGAAVGAAADPPAGAAPADAAAGAAAGAPAEAAPAAPASDTAADAAGAAPAAAAASVDAALAEAQPAKEPAGFWYVQRLASGVVLFGALKRPVEGGTTWDWEAALSNGGTMLFKRKGPHMLLTRYRGPNTAWEVERSAERPQGYAFYDSENHNHGYRFVHLGSGEGGGFPIVGLTAGWLPVGLVDVPRPELFSQRKGEVKVRFLGTFCDPFEAAPPPPLANKIRAVPPRQFGGSPAGQILLTGDGGVTVQPPSTPASFGGPLGKGWRKPGKPGFRPYSFQPKPGKGTFSRSAAPPALNPTQTVAAAFGVTTTQLRDRALFRGKLRAMPHRHTVPGLEVEVPAAHFRTGNAGTPGRPLVSILCLRWYDYWSDPNPASDYNIMNDGYFTDLFHGPRSMGRLLPGEYEVFTIFVQRTRDVERLHPRSLRAMLKGHNAAAWYFVWPSAEGTGYVREPEFFHFCQEMERVPLRSCWPHESTLYRQLCGKLWIPQMSLNKKFRVPPTARVHYAEFARNPRKAAVRALESIMQIRRTVWGKSSVNFESFKGVVKLGFSWCGSDVLPFQGLHSLVTNLRKLFENEICENPTGLVQEMVPGVVGEHRILCMYDKFGDTCHREALWMENVKESSAAVKHNVSCLDVAEFKMASSITMRPEVATKQCFDGDRFAMRLAEQDAMHVVGQWLRWYRTESPEPPQCTRIDFLVTHPGPGRAEVWTCEVGECGASLCSVEVHGRNIASLNSAVLRDPSGRFPQRMPSEIPRNSGAKS